MNSLFSKNNHLFQLARMGQRLPHIILAIILSFVFMLIAQLSGGVLAFMAIIGLAFRNGEDFSLDNPAALGGLIDTAFEQAILLIFAFGPIFLILWGWLRLVEKRPLWTIGLERQGLLWKYLRGALVGLLMFVAAIGISAALGYIAFEEANSKQTQGVAAVGGIFLVLLGWLVQGPGEEAIARGWLLPVIGARYKPWLGVIVSSLIFAIFHSLNPNLSAIAIVNLFLFGLFTALYALYEGGLWGVFSIHTVWNWAQGNLFGFEVSGNPSAGVTLFNLMEVGPDIITGGPFGPEGGLSVTVVLILGCLAVWWADKRQVNRRTDVDPAKTADSKAVSDLDFLEPK